MKGHWGFILFRFVSFPWYLFCLVLFQSSPPRPSRSLLSFAVIFGVLCSCVRHPIPYTCVSFVVSRVMVVEQGAWKVEMRLLRSSCLSQLTLVIRYCHHLSVFEGSFDRYSIITAEFTARLAQGGCGSSKDG